MHKILSIDKLMIFSLLLVITPALGTAVLASELPKGLFAIRDACLYGVNAADVTVEIYGECPFSMSDTAMFRAMMEQQLRDSGILVIRPSDDIDSDTIVKNAVAVYYTVHFYEESKESDACSGKLIYRTTLEAKDGVRLIRYQNRITKLPLENLPLPFVRLWSKESIGIATHEDARSVIIEDMTEHVNEFILDLVKQNSSETRVMLERFQRTMDSMFKE